jgi:hypothetical protein
MHDPQKLAQYDRGASPGQQRRPARVRVAKAVIGTNNERQVRQRRQGVVAVRAIGQCHLAKVRWALGAVLRPELMTLSVRSAPPYVAEHGKRLR